MIKAELIKRSPLRILEKSIHGGIGVGNIGVVVAKKGIGKTAFLVHLATDKLFQGKHVIHVSYSSRIDHIVNWYEDIFKEIAKKRDLESAMDVHDEIIKNRVIMNFSQESTKTEQVLKSVQAMLEDGHFEADQIVIDGYDFALSLDGDLELFKEFAKKFSLSIWFTASTVLDNPLPDKQGVPNVIHAHLKNIAVLLTLFPEKSKIKINLVMDHGSFVEDELHLYLDTKTLLICEE
jgi:KaiC/GvpD/RAD55 family RecA-like ATPase